ncbi:PQQ-binding-like beta-propeller repeat protein [Actinoplanes subtropicus]|uniref:outer membrane protein assembly factor BamB family protein n=1 Tax=Actinoplanes subtropicus TaxID=543632 RepID=UPI0004C40631|nr:PQQ-binding-like beta-propeller repeat protein [Actinoplanes subtropicus]
MLRRLILLSAAALLVLSACMPPPPPSLVDGPLVEMWRLPSPLPAPAGRQWAFVDDQRGYLGEGRRLVSFDLIRGVMHWEADLPAPYAVTAGSVRVGESAVVVRSPSGSVLALSAYDGHTLWEQAGTQAVLGGTDPGAFVFVAGCGRSGCDLTQRDQISGKVVWRRHRTGPVVDMMDAGPTMGGVYLFGPRTLSLVDAADGSTRWSLPRPPGAGVMPFPGLDRTVLVTPPALPVCTATFRGVEDGRIVWTRTAAWDDAGAPAAPCGYDPARLTADINGPLIPVEGAFLRLDARSGAVRSTPREPGQYLVSGGHDEITWTPGVGYRGRGPGGPVGPLAVPPPADGHPWAEGHGTVWVLAAGSGVVACRFDGGLLWSHPAPTPVLLAPNRLIYLDGSTLVAVGVKDRKR